MSAPRYRAPASRHVLAVVDSGKVKCGLSVWLVEGDCAALLAASTVSIPYRGASPARMVEALLRAAAAVCEAHGLDLPVAWIAEKPQKYERQRAKHRDLDALLAVVEALGDAVRYLKTFLPAQWKGQLPKAAHHKRISAALSEAERALLPPASEHDALDAAGIGLFAVGRTGRGAVRAA